MTQYTRAFVAGGMLLVGAAAPVRAERFTGMKDLSGCSQTQRRQSGALVLEGGELRFEDNKGRAVCVLPLAGARAWLAAEKRTTFSSIVRSSFIMMAAIP